jgi:FkbM family methyltransferase
LRGRLIVTSWHDYPAAITGRTERALLHWFAENVKPGGTWLDVGAHYGYTAIALSRLVGPQGRVFAFEPVLTTAGYLAQTRLVNDLAQLVVLPVALGAPETLELVQLPEVRGMVDSTRQCRKRMERILVTRLDWLWPQICGTQPRIDGIKMDVQGMEIQALRGMSDLLREFKPPLVVEIHRGVDRDELLDLLQQLGYSRRGAPVDPAGGESAPQWRDNHSCAFETGCPLVTP